MAVFLELRFAREGWHLRWHTTSTLQFRWTNETFKDQLPEGERYWDSLAFEGRGGWWVAYSWLQVVSDFFDNYQQVRDQLEQPFWLQYEQQRQEARAEQERQQQEERERDHQHEQQQKRRKRRRTQKKTEQERKTAFQPITKPTTPTDALTILKLQPPVTRTEIQRAFRAQAQVGSP